MYAPVCSRFATYDVAVDRLSAGLLPHHHGDAVDAGMDRGGQSRARRTRRARRRVLTPSPSWAGNAAQSHFCRPAIGPVDQPAVADALSAAISAISASLNSKSKMAAFSDSRSSLLVRGMTTIFCCTRKRRQTCAAVFLVRRADARQHFVLAGTCRARSDYRRPSPCRVGGRPRSPSIGREKDGIRLGRRPKVRSRSATPVRATPR